ncbi:hypothetical protein SHO565_68160 [Streptomyces sp. HO565]
MWIIPVSTDGTAERREPGAACSCKAEEGDRAEPWQPTTTPRMRVPRPAPPGTIRTTALKDRRQ